MEPAGSIAQMATNALPHTDDPHRADDPNRVGQQITDAPGWFWRTAYQAGISFESAIALLHHTRGHNAHEIAALMDCTAQTARMRVKRAQAKLARLGPVFVVNRDGQGESLMHRLREDAEQLLAAFRNPQTGKRRPGPAFGDDGPTDKSPAAAALPPQMPADARHLVSAQDLAGTRYRRITGQRPPERVGDAWE